MSRFLANRYRNLSPYVPGEQPKDRAYIKLNANESPLPPCPGVARALADTTLYEGLGRYADPYCMALREAVASFWGVSPEQVFCGNGSDEVLALLMLAFVGPDEGIAFPDVTYRFYRDYASTQGLAWTELPLRDDYSLDVDAFCAFEGTVVFANPNAPTGLAIEPEEVARICRAQPGRLVIVDEAYVDYGARSCVGLIEDHPNLVVVHTMSKSRNLAGAHIGWCIADESIISDMRSVKFSFNPFNLSSPTMAIGVAALEDRAYLERCTVQVCEVREQTRSRLEDMGFQTMPTLTNFIFARHCNLDAALWCVALRERGILARHFPHQRTQEWLRVTVGTAKEMDAFLDATAEILIQEA